MSALKYEVQVFTSQHPVVVHELSIYALEETEFGGGRTEQRLYGPVPMRRNGREEAERLLESAGWETDGGWTGSGTSTDLFYSLRANVRRRATPARSGDVVGRDNAGRDLKRIDLRGQDLTRTMLTGANLFRASLQNAKLDGLDLRSTSFAEADLTGASFVGANLEGANLTNVIAKGAILTDANLSRARMHQIRLSDGSLQNTDLTYAQLEGATLERVSLVGAQINGSWYRIDLEGAILRGVDLTHVDLRNSRLQGADLSDAVLPKDAYMLEEAQWDDATNWGAAMKQIKKRSGKMAKMSGRPQQWRVRPNR